MKYIIYTCSLLGSLLIFSCAQSENDKNATKEVKKEAMSRQDIESRNFEENKKYVSAFYDETGYEIIHLILEERVYKTNDNPRNLRGVPLEEFPGLLNDTVNELKVKLYAERLIDFKNINIAALTLENLAVNFKEGKDELIASSFYRETIYPDSGSLVPYKELDQKIDSIYNNTFVKLKSNPAFVLASNSSTENLQKARIISKIPAEGNVIDQLVRFIKKYNVWIFGLLLVSMLFHVLQYILLKKEQRKHQKLRDRSSQRMVSIGDTNSSKPKDFILKSSDVKKTINDRYAQLKSSIAVQHHKACLAAVSEEFENLKSATIYEAASRVFNSKESLRQFIDERIKKDTAQITISIDEYTDKAEATRLLNGTLRLENFAKAYNPNIISEDEITQKIDQIKQMALSELPPAIKTTDLDIRIDALKSEVTTKLNQIIQDSLVYYFAFADAEGSLQDAKKTKQIERDSAIKLTINPQDITRATFVLLTEREDMMRAAIMSYDSLLIPICELTSDNFNSKGTSIQQLEENGSMELENGLWTVKRKLLIKVI